MSIGAFSLGKKIDGVLAWGKRQAPRGMGREGLAGEHHERRSQSPGALKATTSALGGTGQDEDLFSWED